MNTELKDILYKLESSLLQKEVRQSAEKLDKLVAEDFLEIASTGKTFGKKHVIEDLPKMDAPTFLINSFEVRELSPELAITIFEITKILNGDTTNSMRSSIWKKFDGDWKMIFHQGTIIKK